MPEATTSAYDAFLAYRNSEKTDASAALQAPEVHESADTKEEQVAGDDAATPAKPKEVKTASESDAEDSTQENKEQTEESKPEKKGGFQRRIDKLTARAAELEAELAQARAARPPATEQAKPAEDDKKPSLAEFNYDVEAYNDARDAWKERQQQKAQATQQAQEAQQRVQERIAAVVQAGTEKFDDFDEVVGATKFPPTIMQALGPFEAKDSAELVYALANDRSELARIGKLDPIHAAIEITRLQAKLSAPPDTQKRSTSAPPPPRTIAAGSPAPEPRLGKASSTEEYLKLRKQGVTRM